MKKQAEIIQRRRESVLPTDAPTSVTDITKVDEINSEEQLVAFVKDHPTMVLQMIQDLRKQSDEALELGKNIAFLTQHLEKQNEKIAALEELGQELTDQVETSRRQREATAESAAEDKRRRVRWPDIPILTGDGNPTYKSWVQAATTKIEKDFADSTGDQINYLISRCGGKVAEYLEPRIEFDTETPFTSAEEIFDYLGSMLDDPDPRTTARMALRDLKQSRDETFAVFYTKWLNLAQRLKMDQLTMIENLLEKIPLKLRLKWDTIVEPPEKLEDARKVLIRFDNAMRATEKAFPRPELQPRSDAPSKTRAVTRYQSAGTRLATPKDSQGGGSAAAKPYVTRKSSPERNQLMQEGRCFRCKQLGHRIAECPEQTTKISRIKEVDSDSSDTKSSKND